MILPVGVRKRLWTAVGATLVAAVAVTGAFGASDDSAGAVATRDRAVTDRPDDVPGPQVHFLYVVPSDGADGQLDTNGAMEQSIARIERWFVTQAGSQDLRVDTYNGVPDITFVRLPHSDAQATAVNPWPLWVIGEDLVAAGFNDPAKAYAAFYDGHSTWACGGAKSPALPKLGAMYLQAWPTGDWGPCRDAPGFGTGTDRPGYFEIGLLHEVMHVIGFAPSCAPHVTEVDHVDDSPTDLMYHPDAKSPAGWNWQNAVLDFNRDDYYRANVPGCPDLSNSPYLASLVRVAVTPANPTIARGTTRQFTATGTYSDASTADVTSSVTWASANTAVATISAGGLARGASPGASTIGASLAGVGGSTLLTVVKAPQSITFGALANRTFGDPDFTVSATASSGLAVDFAASGSCAVSAVTVHLTGAGSCTLTASQAGDSNYDPAAPASQTFSVAPRPQLKAPRTCTVAKVVGKRLAAAKLAIKRRHCRTGRVGYAHSRKRKGIVISQSRRPGKVVPANTKINLVVSRGSKH